MAEPVVSQSRQSCRVRLSSIHSSDLGAERDNITERVKVERRPWFTYLDMELFWNNQELKFRVHLQRLKYLNSDSEHPGHTARGTPTGVIGRLANLTTMTEENEDEKMD